jgi:transposase
MGWMTAIAILDVASLSDDPKLLKAYLSDYVQKYQEALRYAEGLEHAITQLRRMHFGPKSERIPQGQQIFSFYGTLEASKPAAARSSEEETPRAKRKPDRTGARVLPEDLPVKVVLIDLPESEKTCGCCGKAKVLIGQEDSKQLDYEPGKFSKLVTRRNTYACPEACRGQVKTAPLPVPAAPIERGLPTASLLAHVLLSKYGDSLPCYRQSVIYARSGIRISRSTLCDWIRQVIDLLKPIIQRIRKDVLESARITTDDTVVRLIVPGKGHTVQARLWAHLGDSRHNQVFYEFSPDRKQEHPQRILGNFKGKIHADAYSGYNVLFEDRSRIEIGCWTHTRRYFWEARDTDPERAGVALGFIRQLYAVEAEARELSPDQRLGLRKTKSAPPVAELKAWLDVEVMKVLPKSPMGEAIRYALGQWRALGQFLGDGEVPLDTNAIERLLRGVAVSRKNFLFVASPEGGRWAAGAYTLIESAKINGVEPYAYLKDVLTRVWTTPQSQINTLMPRLWKAATGPPNSS